MRRRKVLSYASVGPALVLLPSLAIPQVSSINDAINKAGRQRMLSQRAAKSYMALGQKVLGDVPGKVLSASVVLFERQLVELKAFAPTAEIRTTYSQLEQAWGDYKGDLVSATPDKAGAEKVISLAGKVLKLANDGTAQLETVSGKPAGRLVNIAGRQRMLSQRMAAFYLSASWGVQSTAAVDEVKKARDEFVAAHDILSSAPEATGAIKSELALAQIQFTFFDAALNDIRPGSGDLRAQENVFTTSERILQVMNTVTGMYEKIV